MRVTTAGELTVLAATTRSYTARIKVENGSGTMIDLTSWVERVTWDEDIDQPVSGAMVYFTRANGTTQSLSPLRTDSTLNVDDASAVSALLDVGRTVTIEIATVAVGSTPAGGDYKLMFQGEIDATNFEDSPVSVSCRDQGGLLVDRWTGANWATYQEYQIYGTVAGSGTVWAGISPMGYATFSASQAGVLADGYTITVNGYEYIVFSFDGTTHCTLARIDDTAPKFFGVHSFTVNAVPLEDVIQDIFDDAIDDGPVPIAITLNTPVSPAFFVTAYKQQNQSVMDAAQALAGLPAWDIRYKYDTGSGTFKPTLYEPDRSKTTPDYTFGPSQIFEVSRLNIDRTNVRNFIEVRYFSWADQAKKSFTIDDATSESRYGFRYMLIDEPSDSPINSATEAAAVAAAALSDLKDPKAEQEVEVDFFWPAQLGDLYRHSSNSIHYNSNQDYAVVRIEHELSLGHYRTRLKTRGTPAGAHERWFPPPRHGPNPHIPRFIAQDGTLLFDAELKQLKSSLTFAQSSSFNSQGSIIPAPTAINPFSYASGGPAVPAMWIAWTWSAYNILLPNGDTITVPASSSLATPPSPTLSQVAAGALGARTLYCRIGYTKDGLIYRIGAEASLAVLANNVLKVTSPASVDGYDGWFVCVGSAANGERAQSLSSFGTDWTEPATGFVATGTPYNNTNWPNAVIDIDLSPSTSYYYYPYYDVELDFTALTEPGLLAKSEFGAQSQNMDGRVGVSSGGMTGTTPAAAGSGSGSSGGGRLL